MSLRFKIILAAEIGFLVAFGCGFFQMFFFAAKEDTWWINLLTRRLPAVICPAWALDGGFDLLIVTPFLNAAIYAGIVAIWVNLRPKLRQRHKAADV